jgi:ribonuclease E
MTKRMLIDASHAEETRVVVLDGNRLEDFDLEAANRLPLKGNIYLAKVVRVEPSLQAAFVEYGGNRHGFLPLAEIHPDYYQIPVADRQRLLAMQAAEAREEEAAEEEEAAASEQHAAAAAAAAEADPGEPPGAEAGSEAGAELSGEPAEPSREEPEPVLIAQPPVEIAAEAAAAPAPDAPPVEPPAATAIENEPPPIAEVAPEAVAAAAEPVEAHAPEAEAETPPEPDAATIAEQSGPFLLPGEGDQPSIGYAAAAPGAPNGRADDAEGFDSEEAPPPETIGGEAPDEVARERRASTRLMRQYKIQEVIRRRQIMLVQVVKEERGTKGAALTTYISLAGRFSVLMPNSPRGGGVSRKITSAADRRRLREVIDELELPDGMSLIVRTAGAQRPKPEIRRDCEYLLRLWDSIRERTLASSAPALIYEEADLIKRSIRDNYARDVEEILVDGEDAYQEAREFMRMLMPQNVRKIQLHREGGLFARHGVEAQLDAMHSPVVQLRSGGYVVINQTEALVAIDVNSGRSTRERHIEDTAFRTNMEAADEIARQLRLRDLAGLIVIDFIDMESSRHDGAVERRLKDALKHDRARIQVGRISHFGLLEMSRQRLRPSLAETAFVTCQHCHGRGQVRSIESSALSVLRAIEEEGAKRRAAEIAVHVATPVALYLLNRKRDRLARIEQRFGMAVVFEPDDSLSPPALRIDRLRVAEPGQGRAAADAAPSALRMDYAPEPPPPDEEEEAPEAAAAVAGADAADALDGRTAEEDGAEERTEEGRRRRRRRRRRSGRGEETEATSAAGEAQEEDGEDAGEDATPAAFGDRQPEAAPPAAMAAAEDGLDARPQQEEGQPGEGPVAGETEAPLADSADGGEAPRRRRRRRGGGRGGVLPRAEDEGAEAEAPPAAVPLPRAAGPAPAPRYTGPTPADPFAGHVDDIMAAMEAAEAAAEAAASLAGRRARMAAPPAEAAPAAPGGPAPQAGSAEPENAEPSPSDAAPVPEEEAAPGAYAAVPALEEVAPSPPPRAEAAPAAVEAAAADAPEPAAMPQPALVPAASTTAAPSPTAAQAVAAPEPEPATPEPVQGPAVQPRSVDELAADAPRRSGWWRR